MFYKGCLRDLIFFFFLNMHPFWTSYTKAEQLVHCLGVDIISLDAFCSLCKKCDLIVYNICSTDIFCDSDSLLSQLLELGLTCQQYLLSMYLFKKYYEKIK